jgi:hypothetical protein
MKWRVMMELIGGDGTVHAHEVNADESNTGECSAEDCRTICFGHGRGNIAANGDSALIAVATTAEGCPDAAAVVGVRNGGGSGVALFALPVRRDSPSHTQSRRRGHSRWMHARMRAFHCEDGVLAPVRPGPDINVGIPSARRRTRGGNNPSANHAGGRSFGATGGGEPAPRANCRGTRNRALHRR